MKRRTFLRNTAIEIAAIAGAGLADLKAEKPEASGLAPSATPQESTAQAKTVRPATPMHQSAPAQSAAILDPLREPYLLNPGLQSRSISFENPTGARGQ